MGERRRATRTTGPKPSRPRIPGYGIPKGVKGMLAWSYVEERLTKARNYWIVTESKGQPHAVPVWGVWVDGTLCFGGGPDTRWMRNLAANPNLAVHLESGDDVVILEGVAERITDPAHPLMARSTEASRAKYQMGGGSGEPFWALRPRVVFAWTVFPKTATRWVFDRR